MDVDWITSERLRLTAAQRKGVGFLAEFTKRMVTFALAEHKTPASALNLITEIYGVTGEMIAGRLPSGTQPACEMGCAWCCYLRVKVTPLEVWSLAGFLGADLEPRAFSELRQRLADTEKSVRGMDGYQRVSAKKACPLLVDNKCIGYAVRPIACRVYHALSAADCQAALDEQQRSVTVRNDIVGLGMGIFAGLTEGLRAVGLGTRLLELIAGLHMEMDEPGMAQKWLEGEPVFAAAEIANAKEIEGFHQALVEKLFGTGR